MWNVAMPLVSVGAEACRSFGSITTGSTSLASSIAGMSVVVIRVSALRRRSPMDLRGSSVLAGVGAAHPCRARMPPRNPRVRGGHGCPAARFDSGLAPATNVHVTEHPRSPQFRRRQDRGVGPNHRNPASKSPDRYIAFTLRPMAKLILSVTEDFRTRRSPSPSATPARRRLPGGAAGGMPRGRRAARRRRHLAREVPLLQCPDAGPLSSPDLRPSTQVRSPPIYCTTTPGFQDS